MWPFDAIGSDIGNLIADAFDSAMTAIWNAALDLLRAAMSLADKFSVFSVSTTNGPIKIIWPMMLWISGVLALALFFWQLTMTNLRAGRGFIRLIGGPVQYGVILAVTVGLVAGFLAGVDGLTDGILNYGLQAGNFTEAFNHTNFADAVGHGVKAVVLGICAIAGILPAAVGYVLEMLFRQAAIEVLVAVIPIVAAGLLAEVTSSWFWRTARWLMAAIAMKPVLALTLVLGITLAGGSQGVMGLLAGVAVLVISLIAPFALFRLFAFIDPNSDAGGAFRDFFAGWHMDSYGIDSPTPMLSAVTGGGEIEAANSDRFDQALSGQSDATDGGADDRHATADAQSVSQSAQPNQGPAEGGENPPPSDVSSGGHGDRRADGGGGSQGTSQGGKAAGEVAGEIVEGL